MQSRNHTKLGGCFLILNILHWFSALISQQSPRTIQSISCNVCGNVIFFDRLLLLASEPGNCVFQPFTPFCNHFDQFTPVMIHFQTFSPFSLIFTHFYPFFKTICFTIFVPFWPILIRFNLLWIFFILFWPILLNFSRFKKCWPICPDLTCYD